MSAPHSGPVLPTFCWAARGGAFLPLLGLLPASVA